MLVRILIVDDNAHNMRLMEQLLYDIYEDVEIEKASSGETAIAIAKNNKYDLVMMDIALPDMNGIEITNELKLNPHFEKTVFIAATAYAREGDEILFRQVFDDYISKPIDEALLMEKVKKWIGDKL